MSQEDKVLEFDNFELMGNRLLVLQERHPEKSPGGIIFVNGGSKKRGYGKIAKVGPDVKNAVVGDRVFFGSRYKGRDDGSTIKFKDGQEYIWIHEEDAQVVLPIERERDKDGNWLTADEVTAAD